MKISIVTVSYNSAGTIGHALHSVANQTYEDIEHLIIDGQSSDKTMEVVEAHSHPKLIYRSEPDDGIYDAMNKGVQNAVGDVIGVLNSDDFYVDETVLEVVAKYFKEDPKLEVLLGGVDFVRCNELDMPIRTYKAVGFKPWMFRIGIMPPHPSVFVRKSAYERVGNYKQSYRIAADFDFLVRLLLMDRAKYKIVDNDWVRMRIGGASTSGIKSNMVITKEILRSLRNNGIWSCLFLVLLRLPIKFYSQVLNK